MSSLIRFPAALVVPLMAIALYTSVVIAEEGRIEVRVVGEDDQLTPVRAWVDTGGKRFFEPAEPETATPYARDRSFSCDGQFTMVVPAGPATIHLEKGKEFLPVDTEVEVLPGQTVQQTIQIKRWINMPEVGWYSADMHVHLGQDDPRVLRQLALADDVHLVPAFTYWLRGRGETWHRQWPDGTYNLPIVVGANHLITRNNIEIERINRDAAPGATIGATFLFNLKRPVTALRYGEHYPTDAELCRVARQSSPASVFDSDKPSWAETVIGAAFGMLDTVQVCHNHYARTTTGLGGYGMIGPLAPGESNAAVGDGLFHRTNGLYYRFLNCGFRLGVSGGSAIGVKAMPTGHHRVYARIDGPFTADSMWAAIKAGRTFATTGPIITLNVIGYEIGDTVPLDSANSPPLDIRTMVRSIEDLEAIEIIHNGQVVASRDLTSETRDVFLEAALDFRLTPKRSGWVAARVLYRAADGLLRQAHTSPIYISVDDKPVASASDARYMIRWIDRLAAIATEQPDRFPDQQTQSAVLAIYDAARSRYEQIARDAEQHWGE